MRYNKEYIKLGIIIVVILILVISFYIYEVNKKSNYLGYALAYYNENVTYEKILEISENENLTIIYGFFYKNHYEVRYFAPTIKDGEHIRSILLPYSEIKSVALYSL